MSARWTYGLAIFLGAYLLFQVQPLLGQALLPGFGGAAAVWTACLLFFQTLLLVGYAYAHFLGRLPARRQALAHAAMLAASLAFLPLMPAPGRAVPEGSPVLGILGLLAVEVGVPYAILAATGPLLQSWYHRETGSVPYRFYALSNAASLLGLFAYPLLVQPFLDLPDQGAVWSAGYALFAAAMVGCVIGFARRSSGHGAPAATAGAVAAEPAGRIGSSAVVFWIALPATASALLLGITNEITSEMAAVPFLWVLPLALYLVTFILAFEKPGWYSRKALAVPFALALVVHTPLLPWFLPSHGWQPAVLGGGSLFVAAWVCHGELYRLRPHPRRLTAFYLTLSAGGALGGVFVGVAAPFLFPDYWEVPVSLLAAFLLLLASIHRDPASPLHGGQPPRSWQLLVAAVGVAGPALFAFPVWRAADYDHQSRNFYGTLQIRTAATSDGSRYRYLLHGNTVHGVQALDPARSLVPTAYYAEGSGVALALLHHPRRAGGAPLRVGAVGLGAGAVAAWGRPGDRYRFYELDPAVERMARERFTFLSDSPAEVDVVLGDGRLSLESARRSGEKFDVLVVDAFSGGSIPIHLLTRECFEVYRSVLERDGILAVHVSNKMLDLTGVTRAAAALAGWDAIRVDQPADPAAAREANTWILASVPGTFNAAPGMAARATPWDEPDPGSPWTDRRASLLAVLR